MSLRLAILDQSTIASGRGADEAIRETLALAKLADAWGYGRYWLAEHHNSHSHAGSAPEMLVAAIAATTRRIRVGTAGVMLPHYSALKVAEQFKVAEAIAPGRIDLGLGRAPGSDGRTAFALNPKANEAAEAFPNQVMDLLGWLGDGLPEGHPFRQVAANPQIPTRPEVWILGSSDYGAQLAAYFGLPYCFAHFISDQGSEQVMQLYREHFQPQPAKLGRLAAPHAALGVFALTAETEAEAWRLYKSRELWRLFRDTGRFPPLPSVAEAEAYPFQPHERDYLDRLRAKAIVGAPEQVKAKLEAMAAAHGAAEVAVLTPCHDPAARQRSYRLLAEVFGLPGP
ncbi:LLM class flavin-dependent oxidoreductase [Siccirubricoccus sp. KC 17139]|uniref:LLM class flavin-dependent oxidoreductase n=1 Tax=Siccirubricoccus soli TaxID=2899147 RepID=A0ABT1D9U0_9PROT|nr:LLM class flavin-dependent oxidoreductase [Siccirubricoccus soli]MCO6418702.1 LLM class flavin-dependent oxidoreductase [Siccirubricoccus soli]MCP2684837.1 LLM class flavin-dependent oxidoreductase [Siccirubricoccus soli]